MNALNSPNADWTSLLDEADKALTTGSKGEAASLIARAINIAPPDNALSPEHASRLKAARVKLAELSGSMEQYLRSRLYALDRTQTDVSGGDSRGARAIDLLFGQRQLYFQQPEKFYFPDLPQVEFYEPGAFKWVDDLLEYRDAIREELLSFLSTNEAAFEPYVPATHNSAAATRTSLTGNLEWGAIHLYKDGQPNQPVLSQFPKTIEALSLAPQPSVQTLSPIALFSRLAPGAHIPPHHGLINTRLVCHLPIVVPEHCGIRVGSRTKQWREGEMLIFDDSIEHEAWNKSSEERIILLFDIWRPEINEDEQRFIEIVFEAVSGFQGGSG